MCKVRYSRLALLKIIAHLSLISDTADALWAALNESNQALAKTLLSLSDMYDSDPISYKDAVKHISSLQHAQVSLCYRTNFVSLIEYDNSGLQVLVYRRNSSMLLMHSARYI